LHRIKLTLLRKSTTLQGLRDSVWNSTSQGTALWMAEAPPTTVTPQ
jgi:hypothetical protein